MKLPAPQACFDTGTNVPGSKSEPDENAVENEPERANVEGGDFSGECSGVPGMPWLDASDSVIGILC